MTADLHERIAAAVAEKRVMANLAPLAWSPFVLAVCDHADKVLARHRTRKDDFAGLSCLGCRAEWPCPEVRDLADLWLGEGWDRP